MFEARSTGFGETKVQKFVWSSKGFVENNPANHFAHQDSSVNSASDPHPHPNKAFNVIRNLLTKDGKSLRQSAQHRVRSREATSQPKTEARMCTYPTVTDSELDRYGQVIFPPKTSRFVPAMVQ